MWLEPGQRITCELGHPIATANKRLQPGRDDDWMENMTWHVAVPQYKTAAVCQCGRTWFFTYSDKSEYSWWLCVDEVWHPPLTPAARTWLDSQR